MHVKHISYLSLFVILILLSTNISAQNKIDDQGRKQGSWVKYKDGSKLYTGQFKDDYPVGEFIRYYPSGNMMIKSIYSEAVKRRFAEIYYDDWKPKVKTKGLYIDKKKDSLWLIYNDLGILISEEYWKNDTAEGVWKLYDYKGVLVKETPHTNGYINGTQKEYFDDGTINRVINFEMDTFNGEFIIYFPDGKTRIIGIYKKGLKDKTWTYYENNGSILFTENYVDGVMYKRLDAEGNPVKNEYEQDTVRLDIDPSKTDFDY